MIILLNGPFGVGKTTIAEALCSAIPDTMLYDPEIVGTALRYFTNGVRLPEEQTDDFQDIALWPSLTVVIAEHLIKQYRKHLVVPMTIVHPAYFQTIVAGFQQLTGQFFHFCLLAPLPLSRHAYCSAVMMVHRGRGSAQSPTCPALPTSASAIIFRQPTAHRRLSRARLSQQ